MCLFGLEIFGLNFPILKKCCFDGMYFNLNQKRYYCMLCKNSTVAAYNTTNTKQLLKVKHEIDLNRPAKPRSLKRASKQAEGLQLGLLTYEQLCRLVSAVQVPLCLLYPSKLEVMMLHFSRAIIWTKSLRSCLSSSFAPKMSILCSYGSCHMMGNPCFWRDPARQ